MNIARMLLLHERHGRCFLVAVLLQLYFRFFFLHPLVFINQYKWTSFNINSITLHPPSPNTLKEANNTERLKKELKGGLFKT